MITAIQDRLTITVTEMKDFLKITVTSSVDDSFLTSCIDSAKEQADFYCQNPFTVTDEIGVVTEIAIPSSVKNAVMLIASTLFTERNDHSNNVSLIGYSYIQGTPTWNAFRLLQPYRKLVVG